MNRYSFYFVVAVMILTVVSITSCKDDETFMVTFDAENGSKQTSLTVVKGQKIPKPEDPEKTVSEGLYSGPLPASCTFEGWYKGDTKWNFDNDRVEANMKLVAKRSPERNTDDIPNYKIDNTGKLVAE